MGNAQVAVTWKTFAGRHANNGPRAHSYWPPQPGALSSQLRGSALYARGAGAAFVRRKFRSTASRLDNSHSGRREAQFVQRRKRDDRLLDFVFVGPARDRFLG